MNRSAIVFVAILALLLGACASKGPTATAPEPSEPAPVATPAPTPETTVPEATAEPVPSVEVQSELPEDLQELNRRGYLQDIFFATDEYDLSAEARSTLATNAQWLQQYPSVRILVEGHADERNTRDYNLALGERRATAVRDYFVSLGIDPSRVQTISYGEERPFALGHDESAWRLNRRAHFVIVAR